MFCRRNQSIVIAGTLFLAAWLLSAEPAAAWGPGGHRIVANIAYDRLDADARATIVAVLRKHEDFGLRFDKQMPEEIREGNADDRDRWVFLQASLWPDLIRPIAKYNKPTWHYVNMPLFLSPNDQAALQAGIKPNTSAVLPVPLTPEARNQLNCIQAFKLCMRELTDADISDPESAIYFCWLLHLAGDIHQPLHATSLRSRARFHLPEGDRGGNDIRVKKGKNLHSYWDGLLGGEQTLNSIRGRAAEILESKANRKAAAVAAESLSVEVWVQESHLLAKDFVYHKSILEEVAAGESYADRPLEKVDLPEDYLTKAGSLAQRRVAEAGYRLAEILKQVAD